MSGAITWSEAALRLFALDAATAVSAGAGSGKTTCLVELCVRLLSGQATGSPCDPGEVAAVTFTEKAAAELEDRLRGALAARAAAAPPGSDEAQAWARRLHGLQRMAVGTIHGFARRLLREHALEAGVDPEAEVLDEETARGWRRDAARAAVLAALDAGRPEAQRLSGAYGAGGRRTGLADVVAEVVRERATLGDVSPIRPAPGPGQAAAEARSEVIRTAEELLAARAEARTATGRRALEALGAALARLGPEDRTGPIRTGLLPAVEAIGDALRGWRAGSGDGPLARSRKDALLAAAEAFLPLAAEAVAGPQKQELCRLVGEAEARYRARKQSARALDFDDLLVAARALLRPGGAPRHALRQRLRALLVDEYQDVNPAQQDIFEALTAPDADGPGPLLVAVGDLKQSIYRFRGADVAVFRGVLDRLGARGAEGRVLHLSANHRSSPAVLDVVNEVFASCMQPPPGGAARAYELAFHDEDRLRPVRPDGPAPACELLDDGEPGSAAERRAREARAVAARIAAYVSGAARVAVAERGEDGEERPRPPRYGDVAILFRRLTQIAPYERALREAGIPYRLARGGGFYQASEVRDVGELLASLADPDDAIAWAALLRSPWCGLSEGALFGVSRLGLPALARRSPREVVAALLALHPAAGEAGAALGAGAARSSEAERLARFLEEWQALHAVAARLPLSDLLRRAVERLDVEAALLASPDGERRLANLRKAIALAERFAEGGGTASGFAARLRAQAALPPREPEAELDAGDAVALLSVHQAKGLEWPVVFVPDLGATAPRDGRRAVRDPGGALAVAYHDADADVHHDTVALLAAREEGRRAAAAESRRLLYVALTRARDRLVLSGDAARGGETWRGLVEAGLARRPDLVTRVPLERCGPPPGMPIAPPEPASVPGELAIPPLAAPAPLAAVRIAVTELAEQARCPRRVHLARRLGLAERGAPGGASQDDPDRATARGTVAHAMLAELDLAAPPLERRVQLMAAATRRGYDPTSPGVRRIVADVTRFLEAPPGVALATAAREGALRREVPFLLRLDAEAAPSCYLVGAIDAMVDRRRAVEVLDFKYAIPRPGAAERYRWQLLAYALAAARAHPGRVVTARVQFLRGPCAAVDVTPSAADLRRFEREAPRLAAAAHAWEGATVAPRALGRDEARCSAEGCGFVSRCFSRALAVAPAPGPLPPANAATLPPRAAARR